MPIISFKISKETKRNILALTKALGEKDTTGAFTLAFAFLETSVNHQTDGGTIEFVKKDGTRETLTSFAKPTPG